MPEREYLVAKRDGVYGYHNRNPPDDLTTRDHRLELIKKGDVRDALRSAVGELPDAPLHIILSLDADDIDKWYARLEAGFVGGNILLQGSSIRVECWVTRGLNDSEQVRIGKAIGLERDDLPIAIVSTGYDK